MLDLKFKRYEEGFCRAVFTDAATKRLYCLQCDDGWAKSVSYVTDDHIVETEEPCHHYHLFSMSGGEPEAPVPFSHVQAIDVCPNDAESMTGREINRFLTLLKK